MQKIILCASLSALLLLSGCTSCQNNNNKDNIFKEDNTKTSVNLKKEIPKETTQKITKKATEGHQPLKPSADANTTQAEDDIAGNLGELEIAVMKDIQPRIFEETQKIPACLESAETKEEAFECSKSLRILNQDLGMSMGDFVEDLPAVEGYAKDFIWNEETKTNMIREIESGLQGMQTLQTCINAAKTPEEMDMCLTEPSN